MRTAFTVLVIALCLPVQAQPRFMVGVDLGDSVACNAMPPGPFMADSVLPAQVGYSGVACATPDGQTEVNAVARAGRGLVGVEGSNRWIGCAQCPPPANGLNASATHDFDVTFASPTSDAVSVRMNLRLRGTIDEITQQFLTVQATAGRLPGGLFSGTLSQVNLDGDIITSTSGLFDGYNEATGLQVQTPEIASVPVNVPVRFRLAIGTGGPPFAEGGSVNFRDGLSLGSVPFLITDAGGANTPGDIVIDSPDAGISDNSYSGDTGLEPCPADTNGDGMVTPADFNAWVIAFNTMAPECDQNADGFCTPADFNAWVLNFNAGC